MRGQGVGVLGYRDQVDMEGHPAPRQATDAELLAVLADDFCVSDVMRGAGDDEFGHCVAFGGILKWGPGRLLAQVDGPLECSRRRAVFQLAAKIGVRPGTSVSYSQN